jgi:hypothetical protein
MASLSQMRRTKGTSRKPATNEPGREQRQAARRPAYLQARLAVSHPADPEERQADQVAEQVSRVPRSAPDQLQRAGLAPATDPEQRQESLAPKPVPAARTLSRMEVPEETPRTAARLPREAAPKEEPLQARLSRQPEEEEPVQARLMRQAEEETPVQARLARRAAPRGSTGEEEAGPGAAGGESLDRETEQQIEARRGLGDPLPKDSREDMERQLGRDLTAVRVHTDADAAALCARVGARAFTVGNDIFFAPGELAPETEAGRNLLAHELTHVVQQGAGVRRLHRRIDPAPSPAHDPSTPSEQAMNDLAVLDLPAIKQRHLPLYNAYAGSGNLKRIRGYSRGRPAQISVWRSAVRVDEGALEERLRERGVALPATPTGMVRFDVGEQPVAASRRDLLEMLKIPRWDRRGQRPRNGFQVDHIVELQVSGEHGTGVGNSIENMELLDQPSNSSSGATIMTGIYGKVNTYLATLAPPPPRRSWLEGHDLIFDRVRIGSGGGAESASAWWSKTDIEQAEPVRGATPVPDRPLVGQPDLFVLASGAGGIEIGRFRHAPQELAITPGSPTEARRVAGLVIRQIQLTDAAATEAAGSTVGTVTAGWDLPEKFQNPAELSISLISVGAHAGHLGPLPALTTDFRPLSPTRFESPAIQGDGVYAEGSITPTLPLLGSTPILVTMDGRDLSFRVEYTPESLSLPLPGITIDDALVSLAYSTQDGFGATGTLFFSAGTLGQGSLAVAVSQAGELECTGQFDFDSELFDRARVAVWYRDRSFGGEGRIGIDRPDKIRGIRSADVTARFEEAAFSAEGSVQPDIPGVQEAGLTVAYGQDAGLTIGGTLQLSANPAIRSGSIEVTINKSEGAWRVRATGQAQPAIPGIDSQLAVTYDDGAFTAEFSGAYRRGMLSGSITAGATNRALGFDGRPSGEPMPGGALNVFGSGSATVQIAPWLQGTAGIRFDPNGEVTVSGEIALPSQLEIFPRRQIDRSLLNVAVQAPIFPGIVAEVGGGLSATAGIGPGVIDQLCLGIEYNPAHEENTRVTGNAHLNVPADAGLRLSVRAGIGLGITGASATGGLEVGGSLGIEGAAEAGVQVDWTPATGLDIRAQVAVSAQPSFTFDVSGYVSVRALGFSVYDNRWELASFRYGSDYRFGIRLPIHYHEGEPFDISLDDVQFEVPQIDPNQLMRGLIGQIA